MEIKECLKELHEHYAVLFPAVEPMKVQQASVGLVKAGVPPVPADYVRLLAETNGLAWNGMTLFSLENIERNKGAFSHPGIVQNISFCQNNPLMKRRLLLGTGWEELFVYDAGLKQYLLMDRYSYDIIAVFATVAEFLDWICRPFRAQNPTDT